MKVALVASKLDVGGAERQLVELARGLGRAGHEVVVVLFRGGGALEPELDGIAVRVAGKRGRWDLAFLARLARVLRRERADVVYSFSPVANVFCALLRPALGGARLVWAVRASDMERLALDRASRVAYGMEARLAPLADRILVNSEAGRAALARRGIAPGRMRVVPNGVDLARFRFDAEGRARVRAELGLAASDVVVGIVARLDPAKDHPTFLRAAAQAGPGLRFVAVGGGPARAALEALARELGVAVVWTGTRADMAATYSALDVVCLSSVTEGFPNAVAEAMACGRPCVVTDVGDARRIVGDTGVVVPPADAAALARGLRALLDRPPVDTRRRIVLEYSTDALVARTLEELQASSPRRFASAK
jgi:glycosyltransferase involved in cell wall biosynthesis